VCVIAWMGGGEIKCRGAVCFIGGDFCRSLTSSLGQNESGFARRKYSCARMCTDAAFAWCGGYRFPRTPHKIISLVLDEDRTCALNEEFVFFSLFSWRGGEDRIIFLISQTFKYYLLQTLTGDYYYYYYYYRRKLLSSKSLNPRRLSRRLS